MATYDQRSGSFDRGLVATSTVFATARGAASADSVENSGDDFASSELFVADYFIRRSAIEFNLTSIPVGSIVASGTIKIVFNGTTGDTNNYSVNLFYFTRGSTPGTNFEAADYNNVLAGSAACDTPKDISGLTGEQTFTLNAAAIAHIQTNAGGYVQIGAMLSGDSGNSAPTGDNLINAYRGTDATESNRPRLELTYTPPATSGSRAFFM